MEVRASTGFVRQASGTHVMLEIFITNHYSSVLLLLHGVGDRGM